MPHWQKFNGTSLEPMVNSANGIFPKPIVQQVSISICHILVWKELTDADRRSQTNATNSGSWHGWDAGQAWISRIIDEEEEINGKETQRVHYIVRCNEFGWDNQFIQMGYFHKNDEGKKESFQTEDGIAYIGLLDSGGGETDSPVVSEDRLKRRIDFSSALGY